MWSVQIFSTHRRVHKLLNCHITQYFNHTVIGFHKLCPILCVNDWKDLEVHIVHSSFTILHPQLSGVAISHWSIPKTVTYRWFSGKSKENAHTVSCIQTSTHSFKWLSSTQRACILIFFFKWVTGGMWSTENSHVSCNESRFAREARAVAMNHDLHVKHAKFAHSCN